MTDVREPESDTSEIETEDPAGDEPGEYPDAVEDEVKPEDI